MTFSRNDMAEEALLELSREQRRSEPKWVRTQDQWVQREMIRVRDGNGWIEFQAKGGDDVRG